MVKILLSILALLVISSLTVFSQTRSDEWRYEGPRVGLDLSRFLLNSMQSGKTTGWEIQGDIPYKGSLFPTFETGMQTMNDKHDIFHYKNSGNYARVGIDMNLGKFESLKDHDFVFIGARLGYSLFNQQTDSIYNSNYWGSTITSFPRRSMSANWAELLFGMKGEIFPNFFFGWSLRAKLLLAVTKDAHIKPYVIPGIGNTSGGTPFDFSVGVYYRFPIFKSKKMPKPIKMGGAKHPGLNNGTDSNNPNSGQSGRGRQNYNSGN